MLSIPNDVNWHVLKVKHRSEKKVGLHLQELGFESCVPTKKKLILRRNRKIIQEVVLFSNYVFVATDQRRRNEVFQIGNVFQYLSFGGHIATLSEQEAMTIQRLCGLEVPIEISYEKFRVGDMVEILEGPLRECCGTIIAINGNSRIQLALPNLHCFANVEVREVEVRRINNI